MILGKLPPNCVTQYENGRWGFVGSVNVVLGWIHSDGSPIDDPNEEANLAHLLTFGHGFATKRGYKRRTWKSKEEALDCAVSYGLTVT